jgi:ATP-binding cassette subfamily B protein
MSLFTADLETINECFGDGVLMVADALLLGGITIYKMAMKDWKLTLLSLIPMFFMFLIGTIVGKSMMQKWDARQQAYADLSDFTQENFSGIAVVKAFVKEFKELWAFKKLNKQNEYANLDFTKTSTMLHISVTLFVESVMCIIIGYGGYLVYNGVFNAGDLIEFYGYFGSIVWPVMAISQLIDMSSRGKASLNRISALLDAEINVVDASDVEPMENIRGDIEFRNLSFTYPGTDYEVLKDVSFKINAGENVGIIGKTGSGKTSIVDLILRMYNVDDGKIFIDGYDINSLSIKSIRDAAAYVPQDNFLFSDTIENNIGFAFDDKVDMDRVQRSAILSDVHDNIVEFKDQYKTVLGERGVTVSGGQKQRISIARALIKDAPILILDDSVSAVDVKTEKKILQNLRDERVGKTTILIAHRVSTIKDMDKIICIDDGRVIGVGKHDELYATCPEYRRSVDLQKLEDEEGGQNA